MEKEEELDDSTPDSKRRKLERKKARREKLEQKSAEEEVTLKEEECNQRMHLLGVQESRKLAAAGYAHTLVNEEIAAYMAQHMQAFQEASIDEPWEWTKNDLPFSYKDVDDDDSDEKELVAKVDIPLLKIGTGAPMGLKLCLPGTVSQRVSGKKSTLNTGSTSAPKASTFQYFIIPQREAFGKPAMGWILLELGCLNGRARR